jgi:hypothetical protein
MITEKNCILYVDATEVNKKELHFAWFSDDEKTINVFELSDLDYPAVAVFTWNSIEEYIDSIKDVGWINNKDYIIKYDKDVLEERGFPFI